MLCQAIVREKQDKRDFKINMSLAIVASALFVYTFCQWWFK